MALVFSKFLKGDRLDAPPPNIVEYDDGAAKRHAMLVSNVNSDGSTGQEVNIPDGQDAALGSTTDAAVVTDANGTISGKLRGLIALWLGGLRASEAHIGQVSGFASLPSIVFSLDTSAYGSGDLLANTQELTNVFRIPDEVRYLQSVVLNDKDDQGVPMSLVILSANSSLGSENSAPSISDANADNILGIIPIESTHWVDLGGTRVATLRGLGLAVKSVSGTTSLYVGLINGNGTPTFTASGITARFGFV